ILSQLPIELRWKVLEFLTESVGEMRLVSKSWRNMVEEWAIPQNLPEMLVIDIHQKNSSSMNVVIEIRKSEKACFGRLREFTEKMKRETDEQCFSEIPVSFEHCLDLSFDLSFGSPDIDRLASIISTKSKIVHITTNIVHAHRAAEFFNAASALLGNLMKTGDLNCRKQRVNEESA
ncbi:hypothetical protein PMAYCL1PPCAC_33134, partial [Pristionchus mayeri]